MNFADEYEEQLSEGLFISRVQVDDGIVPRSLLKEKWSAAQIVRIQSSSNNRLKVDFKVAAFGELYQKV